MERACNDKKRDGKFYEQILMLWLNLYFIDFILNYFTVL